MSLYFYALVIAVEVVDGIVFELSSRKTSQNYKKKEELGNVVR